MKLLKQIIYFGVTEDSSLVEVLSVKILNQVALATLVLIGLYMTVHIVSGNSWVVIVFDLFYILTAFLILFFHKTTRYEAARWTVGIGYTLSFSGSSLLIGAQNQIEYLLFISGIGAVLVLQKQISKNILFFLTIFAFVGLKIYHLDHPQGLLGQAFSPYFKIFNGLIVFLASYWILTRVLRNNELLLAEVMEKNKEVLRLNRTLEVKVEARTEALKQQTIILEKSNHELKRLSYIFAHDLREPLRNITGFSQLSSRAIAQQRYEDLQDYTEYIKWSVNRINAITRDVVRYTELEEVVQRVNVVDLQAVVERLFLVHLEKSTQVCFSVETLPTLALNENLIEMLFANFIENAVVYADAWNPNNITIACEQQGDFYLFSVKDEGVGIEAAYHQKIFDMFTRLQNDLDKEGSGMGLAINKKIVESYGGELWLESEQGKGSTFFFTLPAAV